MTQGLVRIIVNPISGRGHDPRFVRELVRHLSLRGFPVEVTVTRRPGHARDLARDAPDQARCVVSIGGDGTHREVLSGLMGRPVPACIVPSGTENVLGRTFRLTGTLADTAALIQDGRPLGLDVGLAGDRAFVMFSGVGFDAEVTQEIHRRRRGPILRAAYYGAIMRKLWHYDFPSITVTVDGRVLAADAGVVVVANTPFYGDRLRFAPGAKGDDGLLDVVCFRTPSRWHVFAHYLRARAGRHIGHPLVASGRGKRIEVTCAERRLPIQVDGDVLAATPLVYTVRPRAVRLLMRPDGAGPRRREGG